MKNPKHSSSSHKPPPPSSSNRKSRWESTTFSSDHPSSDSKPTKPSSNPKKDATPNTNPSPVGVPSPAPPPMSAIGGPGSPFPSSSSAAVPPTPPPYGFQNLDRRTIVLADGTVRSYFALPHDYPIDPPFPHGPDHAPLGLAFDRRFSPDGFREPPLPPGRDYGRAPAAAASAAADRDYWSSLGLDAPSSSSSSLLKRKLPHEEDELAWHRHHVLQYGNPTNPPNHDDPRALKQVKLEDSYEDLSRRRAGGTSGAKDSPAAAEVDPQALKRAFLRVVKTLNENPSQKKNYLEDGKVAPLQCVVCGRASKEFTDVHRLILHAYNAQNGEQRVDHLGLHKALCVLMGWNHTKAPDNFKAYQSLSVGEALANREDLIVWPPTVIIHNTNSGRRKDGRMEGLGNKDMDMKLRELGFTGGKSKSMYGKEGHLGFTVVKFANTQAGLKEAERLAEYFEKDNHGRNGWAHAEASKSGIDDEKNPALVKVDEKSGVKKRIFYAYLATASDLEKLDSDMTKRAVIKSRKEFDLSD